MDGMEPLFKEAVEKGLWFYSSYPGEWFSPDELRNLQAEGRFRWGSVNWTLRDPQELVDQKLRTIENLMKSVKDLEDRIRR